MNVASRLQGVAPVGRRRRRASSRTGPRSDPIEYEPREPVDVKGKDEPLPIWRATGARSRFGVDVEQRTARPVDRPRSRAEPAEGALRQGRARRRRVQLVTVVGEPGVGKSRLVWEFQRFIDDLPDLITWRQGRCLPYGEGITFWALGEVVKSHAGILENDTPDEAAEKLRLAARLRGGRRGRTRVDPLAARAAGRSRRGGRGRRAGGVVRRVAELPRGDRLEEPVRPRDRGSALGRSGDARVHRAPVRTGRAGSRCSSCAPRGRSCSSAIPPGAEASATTRPFLLAPLSCEETAQLIAALLERAVLPASHAGHPPCAGRWEPLVRGGVHPDARGSRRAGAARCRMGPRSRGEDEIPVPETVQALIAARLDTLSPARKALLQDAAVIGKVFWAGALAEMGDLGSSDVREDLHELARKELLAAGAPSLDRGRDRVRLLARPHPRRRVRADPPRGARREASGGGGLDRADRRRAGRRQRGSCSRTTTSRRSSSPGLRARTTGTSRPRPVGS